MGESERRMREKKTGSVSTMCRWSQIHSLLPLHPLPSATPLPLHISSPPLLGTRPRPNLVQTNSSHTVDHLVSSQIQSLTVVKTNPSYSY